MMCTGSDPQQYRADTGDSGGPLFFTKEDGSFVQLALVSWGPTEMTATSYDVNANVLFYKDWIETHKNAAFSDYVMDWTATETSQTTDFSNLRNYLYKTIRITPQTNGKYVQATIKSGSMSPFDFVMIYDGDNPLTAKMLAQLTGTLSEQTFTSTTTSGLSVVILTGKTERSEGFTIQYLMVDSAGTSTNLLCPTGYTACADKFFCLNNHLWCSGEEKGQCIDGSDEADGCSKQETDGTDDGSDKEKDGGSRQLICNISLIFTVTLISVMFGLRLE